MADVLADPFVLAALAAFAANADLAPGNDVLTGVLVHLDFEVRARVAAQMQSWTGPLRSSDSVDTSVLGPWMQLLNVEQHQILHCSIDQLEEEPPRPPKSKPLPCAIAGAKRRPAGTRRSPLEEASTSAAEAASGSVSSAALSTLNDLVGNSPMEFRCSIDGRLLVDPVRSPSGLVFERSVLSKKLQGSGDLCPVTGESLSLGDCTRDVELRKQIQIWVRKNRPRQSG
eukprot:TRINITY_DN17063_c0_g2_i1.p1 TRINITY_DN17063_c0_g2~~TRINITY_DN17063_c0_g2_i1.p1  ORF type:complete len:261 (+),score=44.17 TRINITY_DN17063_c0_g2_i1:102-785(+)